jgi:Uma2 family endonuclease
MNDLRKWDRPRKVKLTVGDFLRLDQADAFRDYAKTELIEGEIIAVNAQFVPHARFKTQFFRRLADAVDVEMPGFTALVEVSVAIPPNSAPEPDIVITDFEETGRQAVPVERVALIVEVSDSTLRYDLGQKAKVYAAAGVPEYWVADLEGRVLHQFWQPEGKTYVGKRALPFGETVAAVTIPGLEVSTQGL